MNIREAIYKAGEAGKIKLGDMIFEIPTMNGFIFLLDTDDGYILSVLQLISLDWEAQLTEWVKE